MDFKSTISIRSPSTITLKFCYSNRAPQNGSADFVIVLVSPLLLSENAWCDPIELHLQHTKTSENGMSSDAMYLIKNGYYKE